MKKQKKLRKTAAVALLAAGVTLVTGTFAWQSIRQNATNERTVRHETGGRLHNDFNGETLSVYVENYMSPENEQSAPIFVRVRLQEYLETGDAAGTNRDQLNADRGDVTPVQSDAEISKPETWKVYIPEDTTNPCYRFLTLSTGGSTKYMPTFNKDNTNDDADINGTFEGLVKDDGIHFDDFVDYSSPDNQTATETAYYADGYTTEETHTVTTTQTAEVITMAQWKNEKHCQPGKYWVWDTDGWAYWAEALQPGDATGLLVNKVELNTQALKSLTLKSDGCYYAVHVVNQQASALDWGEAGTGNDDATGFYIDGMTEDALALLNTINVVTGTQTSETDA